MAGRIELLHIEPGLGQTPNDTFRQLNG